MADLDFIPTWSLAIQETLRYRSPPPSISVPYLQLLALSEGHLLSSTETKRLYDSTSLTDISGISSLQPFPSTGPLHVYASLTPQDIVEPRLDFNAEGVEKGKSHDLRKAIMQLQFWCQWAVGFDRMPLARRRPGMEQWLQDGKSSDGLWSERSLIGSAFEGGKEEKIENQETSSSTELDQMKRMKQVSERVTIASLIDSQFERGFARASEVSNLEQAFEVNINDNKQD